jgi:cellulose synthase/poly-beta-1,6-N-acetylglucosamine synthase-like glycosyltransferase
MASLLICCYLIVIALMCAQCLYNLRLRLFIWERPERETLNKSPAQFCAPSLSFTVLLPARHEEDVIAATIAKVCAANYPKELLQILVICEAGDTGTIATVREKVAQLDTERVQLIVFSDGPINKPHGLNKGLEMATGDVLTIFDAEDEPHADIFHIINTIMLTEPVDVAQSGVHLMNYDSRWYSALNVLEYYFWFKSAMHYFAASGMVPLGGNTVFIKRMLLKQLGGWDERCLTEDADIGIRLSALGARVRVVCDDRHVTREESPTTLPALFKQRTRWHQGFLQVLLKGDWLRLPKLSQRILAAYVLLTPFIQALFFLFVPISLVMVVAVKLPVWLAMLTYLPLYAFLLQACLDVAGLLEFIRVQQVAYSWRTIALIPLAFLPYQWLLALAATRAIYRQMQRRTNWEKTAHLGIHRKSVSAA